MASYFPRRSPVEFIRDPGEIAWKAEGWRAWFAPSLPESVISDLYRVAPQQAYLVYANAAMTLTVSGQAVPTRLRWKSDSYNLTGIPIDPANPPTFKDFFEGSEAHQAISSKPAIYRLGEDGRWKSVDRPENARIRDGEAYWVYCHGPSDFQGPLNATVSGVAAGGALDFEIGRAHV